MKYFKIPTIDSTEIEFRTVSAEESDKFFFALKNNRSPEIEEGIFHIVTDNKYVGQELPAGVIITVVYASLKLSGVITSKKQFPEDIEKAREAMSKNVYYTIYAKIASTQNIPLSDLKNKTLNELMELMVFAEMISGKELFDVDKMKEVAGSDGKSTVNPRVKTGVKGLTKEMLDSLKIALQQKEDDPGAYL